MNIDYCPRCQKVYAKNAVGMCGNCIREIENEYDRCMKYLRENRRCSIDDLSEATNVSVKQITKFIRDGRISIAGLPNMQYGCEVCGTHIRDGHICESCRSRLAKDVKHLGEDERRKADLANSQPKVTYQIKKDE